MPTDSTSSPDPGSPHSARASSAVPTRAPSPEWHPSSPSGIEPSACPVTPSKRSVTPPAASEPGSPPGFPWRPTARLLRCRVRGCKAPGFSWPSAMQVHLETLHGIEEKLWVCELCGMETLRRGTLIAHMKNPCPTLHPAPRPRPPPPPKKKRRTKRR
ncbi:hypothetical protein AURDEDRAFT_172690 [Auricularia subglabra TFB-10046 SS5]|nr:hypothetical protein AURDEDRAFT_172690 [Auricularia subglabra TFB-10046 SS5]